MFSTHEHYLSQAIKRAKSHETKLTNRYSLCAILKTNKNTYVGYNKKKTHPLQKEFSKNPHSIYLHAEIDAIRQAYRVEGYLGNSTLYVARTLVNGQPANACPCEGCQSAIKHFDISEVYFTTSNNHGKLL